MLDGGESVPPGYIEYSVRLTKLMSDVRRKIYASPHGPGQGDYPKVSIAIQFLLDLDSWMHSLPPPLRLECLSLHPKHRRAVILLHIQFHHTQALVSRPYLLHKVSVQLARKLGKHVRSQDLDKEEMNLSHACGIYSKNQRFFSTNSSLTESLMASLGLMHIIFIIRSSFCHLTSLLGPGMIKKHQRICPGRRRLGI